MIFICEPPVAAGGSFFIKSGKVVKKTPKNPYRTSGKWAKLPNEKFPARGNFKMFVKNAVDAASKSRYDKDSNLTCYAKLFSLTWYRKGELHHVYTGDYR